MNLFRILIEDDGFTLLCLIAILTIIGSKMTSECFNVRWWGWRAAAVTYVLFACYAVCVLKPTSAADLVHIAFRGLFAAGLTLGLFWILIPLIGVVHRAVLSVAQATAARPTVSTRQQSEAEQRLRDETLRQQADRNARENHEAARKIDAGHRRDEARMRCLMLYDRHGELLADCSGFHVPLEEGIQVLVWSSDGKISDNTKADDRHHLSEPQELNGFVKIPGCLPRHTVKVIGHSQ